MVGALRPGLLKQDGVCPARVQDLHHHVQTIMLKATVNVVASLFLPYNCLQHAAAAPLDLMHKQEAAGGRVDVDDAACADATGAHQSAQLEE